MWMATNAGTFSVIYNDNSFSAQGSFSSLGMFGEMGTERNGSLAVDPGGLVSSRVELDQSSPSEGQWNEISPKFKGRVPVIRLIH
jgi:hypothetical protein